MTGKQEKTNKWFIRITAPWTLLEPKITEMKSWIDISGMAIAYHKGTKTEKEHIHIVLMMLKELQKQSIAERIKKLYGVKGNEQLSIKTWDGNLKVFSYIRHDTSRPIDYFKMELTPAQEQYISSLETIFLDIKTEAKQKASTRIPDRIIEEMNGIRWKPEEIIQRIILGVKNGDWYAPGPRMESIFQEIWIRSDFDKASESLTSYYVEKFSYIRY